MFDSIQGGIFRIAAKSAVFEVADCLSTPLGANFGAPDYGSNRYLLVDQPINALFKMKVFKETAAAIMKHFPTLKIDKLQLARVDEESGKVMVRVTFKNGETIDV